jgi:hypothetical protein
MNNNNNKNKINNKKINNKLLMKTFKIRNYLSVYKIN